MIPAHSSLPVFIVRDLNGAKVFYTEHFGFGIAFENEWYLYLATESDVQIGFSLPDQVLQPQIFQKLWDGQGMIFSLEVEDADLTYAHAKETSLNMVIELRSEDWGQRHFCIQDPNGINLDIIQAIEPSEAYRQGYNTV